MCARMKKHTLRTILILNPAVKSTNINPTRMLTWNFEPFEYQALAYLYISPILSLVQDYIKDDWSISPSIAKTSVKLWAEVSMKIIIMHWLKNKNWIVYRLSKMQQGHMVRIKMF